MRHAHNQAEQFTPSSFAPFVCLLLVFLFLAVATALAHDPVLSGVELRVKQDHLAAHLTFARSEIETLILPDTNQNRQLAQTELAAAQSRLARLAAEAIEIQFDGQRVLASEVRVQFDDSNALHFFLKFPGKATQLSLRSTIIHKLARGHRQHLSVREGQGSVLAERLLDSSQDGFEGNLAQLRAAAARPRSFQQFLVLGVEHILTGYDHLAFLLALLLAGSHFRSAVRVST